MSIAAPASAQSPPDWSTVADEIHCPLCEYNLRGLSEPRCPECGYQFEWPELLDITRRAHPYLFEHHPERNIWSFFRTLFGGQRPSVFWRSLVCCSRWRSKAKRPWSISCLRTR